MAIQEKVYMGNEKFLREQEHLCPECNKRLSVCKLSWTVMPKEGTSIKEYHPDGFKYVLYKFKCKDCNKLYSQPEIARLEKAAADEAARKIAEERTETDKMCKKVAKRVAKKISRDVERDIYEQMKEKYGLSEPKKKKKTLSDIFGKLSGAVEVKKEAEAEKTEKTPEPTKAEEKKTKKHININLSFHKI